MTDFASATPQLQTTLPELSLAPLKCRLIHCLLVDEEVDLALDELSFTVEQIELSPLKNFLLSLLFNESLMELILSLSKLLHDRQYNL